MLDYPEKRDFIRMPVHGAVSLREMGREQGEMAELLDLSAGGVRFVSGRALDAGARLQIMVRPESQITPPLEAEISVIRCHEIDNGFDIAASIDLVSPASYADEI